MGPAGRLVTIKRSGADGPHFPLSLSTCLFGRGVECDIRIQLPVVSRQHCKIEVNEQKAVLFNFSSANPTQVNGSAIDGPVLLRHGDVITVIDRSFRYEDDRCQSGSTSAAFPGQRHGQATPRRVSRSSFSSDPDGEVEGRGAACAQLTEAECVSGEPPARAEGVGVARAVSRSSGGPATRSPPDGHRSEPLGDDHRNAVGSPAGGLGEGSRGALVSKNGGPGAFPSPWCLEKGGEKESPFRKLYESMKEKLDVKSEKENVLQNRRKSGSQGHCAAASESAGGSWGETPLRGSPKCRRRSRQSSQTKAVLAPGQREEEGAGEGPGPTLEATTSPSVPPTETTKGSAPGQCSHQNSSRKRRSGGQSGVRGSEPVNLEQSAALTPKELFPGHGTPTKGESADGLGNTPEKVFSRKRRSSFPPKGDILATETEIPKPAVLTPLLVHVERKVPGGLLGPPQDSPGLNSIDVSDLDESIHKMEGVPLKTRRVSFGGCLRPELFDENLPPNTPLKRGETPMKRRSLVTHAPAVLKKIIKGQPQESGKEDSSEIRLEVTAQNVFVSSPACHPTKSSSVANDDRRRSSQPPASSGSRSPPETGVPKRGGRRSSGAPSQRTPVGRGQHGTLQMTHSRRRGGASEANVIAAKSWADIVKLSAKQTQAKAVKHGPPRRPSKRQRRANTPKKPTGHAYSEFSTGHANSPCTIVIGKAHVEKATVPARPYRMLNSFVFNKKIDFNEDLSGLTEMFKTPAKEKPKKMSLRLTAFSNSEGLFGKQFQVPKSEGKPLPCTPAKSGENVFPSAQNAPEEPSDKKSASPALRRQYVTANKNRRTPPSETQPSKTASSANKSRRSVGLGNSQVPGTECGKEDPEFDTVENILGRCLRKSSAQAQRVEGEVKESERALVTCKRNIESKENSEKRIVVRRSRRSSELNCAPRTDVIARRRLQATESKEDLVGIHCFPQSPDHAQAPVDMENKATARGCGSSTPEPVSTPAGMNGRIMTPSQRVRAEALSVLRKPAQTPGETMHTHKEPVGSDESMNASKKTPEQQQDSAEHVIESRRPRTPKKKPQSIEDLAGLKELFQTPNHIVEPVTEDKTMEMPSKSPKPEPVSTPTSTKRRLRTPLGKVDVEEELSALRESTPSPGETTHSPRDPVGDDEHIRALKGTPEQKLDSTERVTGSRRRTRTPKRKVEPTEDLTGFKELFQTPNHVLETVTTDKTTKVPSKSPKPEPVSTPTSTKRRLRTPLGKVGMEEELPALRESTPTPGETTHSPRDPEGDEEDTRALKGTPEQKVDSAERVTGSRRRSRTSMRKVEPTEDLTGFKELFQTPNHVLETMTTDKTTKVPSKSPKPEPVSTPTSTKRRLRTPLGKVDGEEELSALRESTPTPGETTHSPGDPGNEEDTRALKGTPEQKWDSAERVTGSRRRSRTSMRKVEPTEDLTGFKEFFQTPNHVLETVTTDKTTKVPSKSPKPEPVSTPTSTKRRLRTPLGKVDGEEELSALRESTPTPGETTHSPGDPGNEEDTRALKGTPEQKWDSAERVTGSRRRSRTSMRKVEPTEDLTGFEELFQTPNHVLETVTTDKTTKVPSKSPKPEPVSTPTSTKRRLRTPLGKVDGEEELPALRESTPTPGETTHSPRDPEGDEEDTRALKGTPEQKVDSAERVTGSRRRSRTSMRKVEPTEDLTGFKELFQTPNHVLETMTTDKTTKVPSKSPKPEPVSTPTSTKRRLRTPLGKVDGEEELSALRESTPTPGETTHSPGDPGNEEDTRALKGTPEQKWDSAERVTGSRRRSRTSMRKVEPTEDLTGFEELFQTPNHVLETVTTDKTTKVPSKSPKPEPVSTPTSTKRRLRTPLGKVDGEEELSALRESTPTPGETTHSPRDPEGDEEDTRALKGTPEQKWDSAERVTGSRRRTRTPKRKVEPTEDLTGFEELFQTPNHVLETVTTDKTTKVPSKSPKPEPVSTPTSTKRRLRTPLGKVDVEEELSALRESTPSPGETTHSPRDPVGDDEHIRALKGTPEQKLDSGKCVTGSRRRTRTPKRKVEPTEDLTGFKELFQTPNHVLETVTTDKTTKVPSKSPKPEPVSTPTSTKRRLRTPLGKVDGEEELSALRESTPTPGETTHSPRDPEGDEEDTRALKGTPEQKWDSAERVTGSRRRSRTSMRKVEPTEDLTGFKELFQTPNHIVEPVTEDKTMKMPSKSPKPEPVSTPTSTKRRLRTPLGKVDVEEELSALRESTPTPGETTHSPRDPEGDEEDTRALKGTPEQKWDSAERVTGSRRRSRTLTRVNQSTEDLAGFKELFQTPSHTVESMTEDKATEMPCKSARAEPAVMPSGRNRRLERPPGKVAVKDGLSVLWSPTRTSRRATRLHRELEGGEKDMKLFKESLEQKLHPAENVTASKRKPKTRKEKAQVLEDPTSLKEVLQIPNHTEDPVAVANSTEMPSRSRAEAVIMPARTRRQLKAPPGMVAMQEEPSGLRRPTGTSGKTMRSHREQEGVDKDMKLFKESLEQKLDPEENVTASKKRPRTRKEKAQFLEDPASLKELLQIPNHTEDPVAVANSTEMPSSSRAEAVVMPARTRRQLKAPPGMVAVQGEPSGLRRPTGTSGKTMRSHREPVDGAKDTKACKGSLRREPGPVGNAVGGGRLLRPRKGKAQPPRSPADSKQLLQSPAQDKELGTDAAGVTRTSTQTPDQSKPVTTSRRALRALNVKPTEELVGSRDPVESQSEGLITLSPKRKREDGSCTGPRRLRPRTHAQDTAEEKPPRKRQRTAPREQCAPPEPSEPKKGRRVVKEDVEPVEDLPSANGKTKNKGRKEDVTSPDKGVSLRSRLPNKSRGAERRPELLVSAGKAQRRQNEEKPVKPSQEVGIQNPEGGAQNSTPGDKVHERRLSPRPGRRGKVPVPRGAEEEAQASSAEAHGKTQEEKEGAPRSGFICLRSRKVTVPPTGDTLESQSKQRVTRSAKRPVEDAGKENDNPCVKKMRARSRRGQ